MIIAAVLFAIAALGGITLAIIRLKGRELPPMALAVVHGLVAAAGLVALIVAISGGHAARLATAALMIFLVAALGGFALFSFHLRKKGLPISLVAVHGVVAVIAFVVLLYGMFAAR